MLVSVDKLKKHFRTLNNKNKNQDGNLPETNSNNYNNNAVPNNQMIAGHIAYGDGPGYTDLNPGFSQQVQQHHQGYMSLRQQNQPQKQNPSQYINSPKLGDQEDQNLYSQSPSNQNQYVIIVIVVIMSIKYLYYLPWSTVHP